MAAASSGTAKQNTYIYQLPFTITREICMSLDIDKAWEKLASEIGYTLQEVKVFEMAYRQFNGSPTKDLLTDWGARNPTATDLYFKLQKIQRKREMQILETWFTSTSNRGNECNMIPIPSRSFGVESLSDLETARLPRPKPQGRNAVNTSSTNASMSSLNDNYNFNKPEKTKSASKVIDEKDILSFVNNKSLQNKKYDGDSMKSVHPEPSIHEDKCHMSSLGEGKGDMGRQPSMDSDFMERLKSYDGYSSLNKDGSCDIDVAVALMGTQTFTNKELNQATNGFSDACKLGEGAFGSVYYGVIRKSQCAIKRLNGDKEFYDSDHSCHSHLKSEIKALIRFRHENIVPLYGYALDGADICLVYQYMPNGSLEDRLRCKNGSAPLCWRDRLSILRGAACGLQYLHTPNGKPLIHGDIKSSNVLLDKHMEAKIGDLGLAQSITGGTLTGAKTHITKQEVHSKVYQYKAYYPPESTRGSKMSLKGDTYSFGVVMYEVCTGEKAYDEKREGSGACFLAEYIHELLEEDKDKCLDLIDPREMNCPKEIFKMVFSIADKCTKKLKKDRPNMAEVFDQMEQIENDYRTKYRDKQTSANSNYPSKCTSNTESQEPEALMLQKMYDGAHYPPSTPDTADSTCNDFKNPFFYPSNPDKLEEIRKYEAEFKSKDKEAKEMTSDFKSFKKEYEVADDGNKVRPGSEGNTQQNQCKKEEISKFNKENMSSDKVNVLKQPCEEKCEVESGGPGNASGLLSHDKTQQECDSQSTFSQDVSGDDDVKQVCVVQAASAEENEKLKQTRDDFLAKYEELIQQGGGVEDYDYEGDEFGDEFSFFNSDFDTVRFQNDGICDTEGCETQDGGMVGTGEEASDNTSKFYFKNDTSGDQTQTDNQFSRDNVMENRIEQSDNNLDNSEQLNLCMNQMTVNECHQTPAEGEESDSNCQQSKGDNICTDCLPSEGNKATNDNDFRPAEGEESSELYSQQPYKYGIHGSTNNLHPLEGDCASRLESGPSSRLVGSDVNMVSNISKDKIFGGPSYKTLPNTWKYKKAEPSENIEQYV